METHVSYKLSIFITLISFRIICCEADAGYCVLCVTYQIVSQLMMLWNRYFFFLSGGSPQRIRRKRLIFMEICGRLAACHGYSIPQIRLRYHFLRRCIIGRAHANCRNKCLIFGKVMWEDSIISDLSIGYHLYEQQCMCTFLIIELTF